MNQSIVAAVVIILIYIRFNADFTGATAEKFHIAFSSVITLIYVRNCEKSDMAAFLFIDIHQTSIDKNTV